MDFGALLGGGVVITFLLATWNYMRALILQLATRIIGTMEAKMTLGDAIPLYCWQHFTRSPFGVRTYLGWWVFVRTTRRNQAIAMEIIGEGGRLYWYGWRPIWVYRGASKTNDSPNGGGGSETTTRVVFIRGTLDPDRFVTDCIDYYNRRMSSADASNRERRHFMRHVFGTDGKPMLLGDRGGDNVAMPSGSYDLRQVAVHRLLQWQLDDLGPVRNEAGQALATLALPPEAETFVKEVRRWKASEEWYRARGLSWRHSGLFQGGPGTGKTSMVRALAEDLDLPIFIYHLATLYDDEIQREWSRMLGHVPCIALIEDIDAVFDGRDNKVGKLTFDSLLNCMDGVERTDGLITIVTTNRLDKLDPAIGIPDDTGRSSRPGRIDRILHFGPLSTQGRMKLCQRILRDSPELQEQVVQEGDGETGAQFENRCSTLALQLYWDNRDALERFTATDSLDHGGSQCGPPCAMLQRDPGHSTAGAQGGDGVACGDGSGP